MRRKTRKVQTAVVILAALAVLVALAGIIVKQQFVVRNVVVEGAADGNEAEIIRTAKVQFGSSIFRLKEGKIRQNLESTGQYAMDGMRVHYPNTVVLQVRQRTLDAVMLNGGKYLVMDSDGYVVQVHSVLPADVGIYVYGLNATSYRIGSKVTAPEDRLRAMKCVLEAVRSQGAGNVVSDLDVENVNRLVMTTNTGMRVELGDMTNMENKILWLRTAVGDLASHGSVRGTLDVSSGTKADYLPE